MRTLLFAIPASMLLLASNAGAQSKDYPLTSGNQISTVQVTAPAPAFQVSAADTDWISGAYAMSNGWRLEVQPADDGIVATIDKERPMHLMATSADDYMTPDGNVAMTFNRGEHGDQMLMSYVPSSTVVAAR